MSDVRSSKLIVTLGTAGAIAGLLIAAAYTTSLPAIKANRAARIDAAIHDVLKGTVRYDTLLLRDGRLVTRTSESEPESEGGHAEEVYAGFDASGKLLGFAFTSVEPGFQDPIELLIGYDPRTRNTLGVAILSSRETPGLGDKIQGKQWLAQFSGLLTPLIGRKAGSARNRDEVDMITGATISSRAVIGAVNKSVAKWTPVLGAYLAGGGS